LAAELRSAVRADVPEILRLIRALAEYEKLSGEVVATEAALAETLFGARPAAEVLLAEEGGRAIGFALFSARHGPRKPQCGRSQPFH